MTFEELRKLNPAWLPSQVDAAETAWTAALASRDELGPCGRHPVACWMAEHHFHAGGKDAYTCKTCDTDIHLHMPQREGYCTVCEEVRKLVEALQQIKARIRMSDASFYQQVTEDVIETAEKALIPYYLPQSKVSAE